MYAPDQNVTRLSIRDDTAPGVFRGVSWVTVRLMSDGELSRLEVPMDLDRRLLTTELAGRLPGLRRALPLSRSFAGVNTGRRRSEIPASRFLARGSLLLIRVAVEKKGGLR